MKYQALFAGLLLAGLAFPATAQDEEESKKLEGYSVGQQKLPSSIDAGDMKIEIEKPSFDTDIQIDKPKPGAGLRIERPRFEVMQQPAQPARSPARPPEQAATPAVAETRSIRPLELPAPDYPVNALRRGQEGFVVVSFVVAEDGSTSNIDVVDSEPRGVFDREAMRAVARWRFEPALRDGKPVRTQIEHTIDFSMSDN